MGTNPKIRRSQRFGGTEKLTSFSQVNSPVAADFIRKVDNSQNISPRTTTESGAEIPCLIECLVCHKKTMISELYLHLLFGYLRCLKCQNNIDSCDSFRAVLKNQHSSKVCSHAQFDWTPLQQAQIKNKSVSFLKSYLNNTSSMREKSPWHLGYRSMKEMLQKAKIETTFPNLVHVKTFKRQNKQMKRTSRGQKSSAVCNKPTSGMPSKGKLVHKECNSSGRKDELNQTKTALCAQLNFIELPKDDRYYVTKEFTDECPLCYWKTSAEDLVLYVSSFLVTFVCRDCKVKVFIVRTPPGVEEVIRIVI